MYTVVNFNLPDGLDVKLKDYSSFFHLNEAMGTLGAPNKVISIEVPDSGGEQITLMKYVVGERIAFRKSLTGLKLIRGLPDHTGYVTLVDITSQIPDMVKKVQYRYQERQAAYSRRSAIPQSNLCMEVPLPGGDSYGIDWASITSARTHEEGAIGALMAQQVADMANSYGFTRRLMEGGTVTGRATGTTEYAARQASMIAAMRDTAQTGIRNLYYQRSGRTTGRSQPIAEMSRRYTNNFWADFDGDTAITQSLLSSLHHEAPRMPAVQEGAPPQYVDNRHGITEVDFAEAIRATAEVVQGERGRPPASRGPRPRNQRW